MTNKRLNLCGRSFPAVPNELASVYCSQRMLFRTLHRTCFSFSAASQARPGALWLPEVHLDALLQTRSIIRRKCFVWLPLGGPAPPHFTDRTSLPLSSFQLEAKNVIAHNPTANHHHRHHHIVLVNLISRVVTKTNPYLNQKMCFQKMKRSSASNRSNWSCVILTPILSESNTNMFFD